MTIRAINKICTFLMLAIALTACSSHDDPAPEPVFSDDMPMHFTSSVATPITRAANLLHDNNYQNFGIWTWKLPSTASVPYQPSHWLPVMEHYRVGYQTQYFGDGRAENGWGYDKEAYPYDHQILKYWDLSSKQYDFKGYAPFCGATGTDPHAAIDAINNLHFYNISGHYAAMDCKTEYSDANKNKIDWVYCYGKRTLSPLPDLNSGEQFDKDMAVTPNDYLGDAISKTSTVPLRFHHLLPKVIFRIHVYDPELPDNEQLINIGIDIKANTVTMDKDIKYGEVEIYGTSGNTNEADKEYVDRITANPCSLPVYASPTYISFHKEKNTDYRDLSPSVMTADGDGVVTYDRQGWMEVPQKAPTFTINMTADDTTYTRTLDPSKDLTLPQEWESDHIYIYIIQFNVKSKTLDTTSYVEEWDEDSDEFQLTDW